MPKYASVIICTYNRASLLERALGAMARQSLPTEAFEVVVVDDGSEDETPEVCRRMGRALPNLRYVALGANRGKARALNAGVGRAAGEHLLFTDDDCIPGERWVELMSAGLERAPIVAGAVETSAEPYLNLCQNLSALHAYMPDQPAGRKEMVAGANSGYRRSVLESLGGFQRWAEPAEDMECVLRARERGYRVEFLPEAVVTHDPRPLTLGEMVRYAADHAAKTIILRSRHRRLLRTPLVLRSPWLLLAAAPVVALKATAGIYLATSCRARLLRTAPVVYLLKLAWCWGAARGLRGAPEIDRAEEPSEAVDGGDLGESGGNRRLRVCVAVAQLKATISELNWEFGEMMVEVLAEQGFSPTLVWDGDRRALEADLLLMFGDGKDFEGLATLLREAPGRRPTTVLWQIDPLPPPDLSPQEEAALLREADEYQRLKLGRGRLSRLIKSRVQGTTLSWIKKTIHEVGRGGGEANSGALSPLLREVKSQMRMWMILRYTWLKRSFDEGWLDHVFASDPLKLELLARRGTPIGFAPLGYHPGMGEVLGRKRDVDVLFLGSSEFGRRRAILGDLGRSLAARGIGLEVVERYCLGRERAELMNRARISLNLTSYPWDFQGARFLLSIGCGALVVSEPLRSSGLFRAGEHFVQAEVADLPEVIAYYVAHEAEREALARSALGFVERELTLRSSLAHIMEVCHADSAVSSDVERGGD